MLEEYEVPESYTGETLLENDSQFFLGDMDESSLGDGIIAEN